MKNKSSNPSTSPFDASSIAQMANAKPQGKRPEYFSDPMAEQSFSITMALMAELAVARERIDSLERILEAKGIVSQDEINSYVPDQAAGEQRQTAQTEYCARVFRALQQQVESMQGNNKSVDDMADELGKSDV